MTGLIITGVVFLVVFGIIFLFKWAIKGLDEPNKHRWDK